MHPLHHESAGFRTGVCSVSPRGISIGCSTLVRNYTWIGTANAFRNAHMLSTVLIGDDDPHFRRVVRGALENDGFTCWEARNGYEVLEMMHEENPDLILLDLMMPRMDGIEACRRIRRESWVPVIAVSECGKETGKIEFLDAGANQYLTKPFSVEELLARIRVLLRGRAANPSLVSRFSGSRMEIDFDARQARVRGERIHLTGKQLHLLQALVTRVGQPVSHRDLLRAVWGPERREEIAYLRVVVNQLRKKIEMDPERPEYILTEHGVGYVFPASRFGECHQ
jgi:two-component system KDP operon response regulator KdpE